MIGSVWGGEGERENYRIIGRRTVRYNDANEEQRWQMASTADRGTCWTFTLVNGMVNGKHREVLHQAGKLYTATGWATYVNAGDGVDKDDIDCSRQSVSVTVKSSSEPHYLRLSVSDVWHWRPAPAVSACPGVCPPAACPPATLTPLSTVTCATSNRLRQQRRRRLC